MKSKFALLLLIVVALLLVLPTRVALASNGSQETTPIINLFSELNINGLSFMLLVIGIVQAAKKLGVAGRALTLLAMVLGTLLAIGYQVSVLYPQFKVWYDILLFGLGGGVAATGYYDLINERIPKLTNLVALTTEENTHQIE